MSDPTQKCQGILLNSDSFPLGWGWAEDLGLGICKKPITHLQTAMGQIMRQGDTVLSSSLQLNKWIRADSTVTSLKKLRRTLYVSLCVVEVHTCVLVIYYMTRGYSIWLQHPNTRKWVLFISFSSLFTMELVYLSNSKLLNGSKNSKVLSNGLYKDLHSLSEIFSEWRETYVWKSQRAAQN